MQAFRAATIPYDSLPARTDTAFFMRYAGLINGWGRCNRKFAYFAEIPLYLYGNREPTFRRSALNCRFTRNWLFRELGAFRGEQHFADIFDHMQERSVFKELGVNESASRFTRVSVRSTELPMYGRKVLRVTHWIVRHRLRLQRQLQFRGRHPRHVHVHVPHQRRVHERNKTCHFSNGVASKSQSRGPYRVGEDLFDVSIRDNCAPT